jgi:hypothetical protein
LVAFSDKTQNCVTSGVKGKNKTQSDFFGRL